MSGRGTRLMGAGLVAVMSAAWASSPALALDEAHYRKARTMIEKSIEFLRSRQDAETGGWSVSGEGPKLPAISGLVLNGLLMERDIDATDPAVARGVEFILSFQQPDGGIYDGILANYNTALCVSALSRVNTAESGAAIEKAIPFLRGLQWSEDSIQMEGETAKVDESHPFYGGVGYGSHGRPDNSNLNLMLQALHDAGVSCDDEAFRRAVAFLQRTQMTDAVNDMAYADGSDQGGFIYATGETAEKAGQGESKAGMIEETLDDGTKVSRLRAYGSITYAGFKSYIYANLERDDPRVRAAYDWIRRNYTLEENPGVGTDGYYYYLVTFSRALDAWGLPVIEQFVTHDPDFKGGVSFGFTADGMPVRTVEDERSPTGSSYVVPRDWANELIDTLANLQEEDGSFKSVDSRWMEDNPVLITAYALLALQHAVD